jgi:acyl-CoA synthetase (AMP-forming)/AMP-acid ligase II
MAIMGEDGSLLRDDAHGEIVIRGPLVMDGYLDDPAATAAATHEGWHRTGDIGYRDADGFFYLVDRSKDLIISGGFNVFPGEVERALLAHPAIRDCAVIGVPDEKWGEAVTAVVELRGEAQASEAELRAHCRQLVGPVKSPKQVIFEALPRSGAGKVLKRELRERFWAGMDRRV